MPMINPASFTLSSTLITFPFRILLNFRYLIEIFNRKLKSNQKSRTNFHFTINSFFSFERNVFRFVFSVAHEKNFSKIGKVSKCVFTFAEKGVRSFTCIHFMSVKKSQYIDFCMFLETKKQKHMFLLQANW